MRTVEQKLLVFSRMVEKYAKVAHRKIHRPTYLEIADLEQEGYLAVVRALRRHKASRGPLAPFVQQCLEHALDTIIKTSWRTKNGGKVSESGIVCILPDGSPIPPVEDVGHAFVEAMRDIPALFGDLGVAVLELLVAPESQALSKKEERRRIAKDLEVKPYKVKRRLYVGIRRYLKNELLGEGVIVCQDGQRERK